MMLFRFHSLAAFVPTLLVALSALTPLQPGAARADDVIPADAAPRWWKGNLHTHTFWSDGDDFPEMVAEWYRTHGYHFLALTDHNVLAQGLRWEPEAKLSKKGGDQVIAKYLQRFGAAWVEIRGTADKRQIRLKPLDEFRALVEERGRFLLIPAEEISDSAENVPIHINASNIKEAISPSSGETVREAITNNLRAVEEQAVRSGREILAHLNHPNFHYAITAEDIAHVVMERHFEVYNGHPTVNHTGDHDHPSVERLWDLANTIRLVDLNAPPLFGIATDDSHNYHDKPAGASPGRGWTMVRATHLTPEHILRAVKSGDCYASSGVTLIDVRHSAERSTLELEIQPEGAAIFETAFIGSLQGVDTTGETSPPPAGKPTRRSQRYSEQIGQVLHTAEGLRPHYAFTGKELYVRAVVTSSLPPNNPSFKGQRAQAWTQPVGWKLSRSTEAPEPAP